MRKQYQRGASRSLLAASLPWVLTAGFSPAQAQVLPPDAGSLSQRIERERSQALPTKAASVPIAALPPAQAPNGISVTAREFRFAGNTLLNEAQLRPTLQRFLNRPLDFTQLQAAAAAVAQRYREAGWVVRCYLPAQDIKDGVVTLQIVEARFGRTRVEGAAARVKPAQVEALVQAGQASGQPLSSSALERAVLLADDLPGVSASGAVATGAQGSETDLVLTLADEPALSGEAIVDNTGARSTGSLRAAVGLRLNSPARLGDQAELDLLATEGSHYGRLEYTLPVGSQGWRVGLNGWAMKYRLIGTDFEALDAKGTARSAGISASYPLLRTRTGNVFFSANADSHRFDNTATRTDTRIEARLVSGSPLPAWIHFDRSTRSFSVQAGPDRVFPLHVLLITDQASAVVTIYVESP